MTINIDTTEQFTFTFNTPNIPTTGIFLRLDSQYSNDVFLLWPGTVIETNERYSELEIDLTGTDISSGHHNGIYYYQVLDNDNIYDMGLCKLITNPGGSFGKVEYVSGNENREAQVFYRPNF